MPKNTTLKLTSDRLFKAVDGRRMEIASYNGNLFDSKGYVYVRELGGYSSGGNSIRNVPTPMQYTSNVYIGEGRIVIVKTRFDGTDYVAHNDVMDMKQAGINIRQLNANDPSTKYRPAELISNLQSYPTGGDGTVLVQPGIYRKPSGTYGIFSGQVGIDLLTSYTPSSVDNQHIVALWLNTDTNGITITTSDEFSGSLDLKNNPQTAVTYINQAVLSAPDNRVGITSYLISGDDTVISETNKFHDLRGIIESINKFGFSFSPLTNGDPTTPELIFLNGDTINIPIRS